MEVEDPEHLDTRRKEVELAPYHEDLQRHKGKIMSEGGKPPEDFAEYKRKAREWAKNAGW